MLDLTKSKRALPRTGGLLRRISLLRIAALVVIACGAVSCRWVSDYYVGNHNFKREDYPYSIVRYERFLEKYRKPKRKREIALVNLGRSYMAMRAYRDAEQTFARYEQEFPDGYFLDATRQSLAQLRKVADNHYQQLAQQVEAAKKEAKQIEAELAQQPNDADLLIALGNAHWKMGQYKSAGEAYLRAIEVKPELRDNPLLLERLIFDMQGNLVPVTSPDQLVALRKEREPLVIESLHERTSRGVGDFSSARRRFYMVTGMIRNRSTRPILGVQVEVTLYDGLGQILEVGTATIGTLYPQQSRPFVVRSGLDAEAMNNIMRYRCQPLYQQ